MTKKSTPPSIKEQAFDCPHCGAYTTQFWFDLLCICCKDNKPHGVDIDEWREVINSKDSTEEDKTMVLKKVDNIDSGLVYLETGSLPEYFTKNINYAGNINFSKCYNCEKIAVWIHSNLVFPNEKVGVAPNPDLPEDIISHFEEARSILRESPRGAAALLRLCVQKLCVHLGEKGKNIDDNIASLVDKGLNSQVQRSLDIVRVIGNEAVHPGVLNLNDDPDTVFQLLGLINGIADQMITHPQNIDSLYEKLPEAKRKAIEKRDEKRQK